MAKVIEASTTGMIKTFIDTLSNLIPRLQTVQELELTWLGNEASLVYSLIPRPFTHFLFHHLHQHVDAFFVNMKLTS